MHPPSLRRATHSLSANARNFANKNFLRHVEGILAPRGGALFISSLNVQHPRESGFPFSNKISVRLRRLYDIPRFQDGIGFPMLPPTIIVFLS